MNSVYVLGQISVKDADKWLDYRSKVPDTLAPWGAELVFRGTQSWALVGSSPHPDVVLIRFPHQAAVDGWYASAAYQSLIHLRQSAADMILLTYEAD